MSVETREYGHWPSPLEADALMRGSETLAFMRPGPGGLFFLLSRPEEDNRLVLMHRHDDGELRRLSPDGISVRSRVHEYGGLPWAVSGEQVCFCNFSDQRLMIRAWNPEQGGIGPCRPLTPEAGDGLLRYADLLMDERRQRLLAVREDHRGDERHPRNTLVSIDLDTGGEGEILFEDSDFVAAPALSPDGDHLAFISWSHPDMPWDETRLHIADLDPQGRIRHSRSLRQPRPGSVLQPRFGPGGDLFLIADWNDWWNLYRVEADSLADEAPEARALISLTAECCAPPWQLGHHSYDIVDDDTLLLSINRDCFWELARLDCDSAQLTPLVQGLGALEHVFHDRGRAVYCAVETDAPASVQSVAAREPETRPSTMLRCRSGAELTPEGISRPQHISYPTTDDERAFALFYPPCNPRFRAPEDTRPPLLVFVHGGPTSSARAGFNPSIQFWTSRGFAVVDVNHRGSTGYGRRFRRRLYGRWGEADVADVVAAVEQLVEQGLVSAERIAIRGGSAGGYVVLSTLVASDLFGAGTSYYGVSDLSMLAADTHKFESRYLDQLIGPWPEAEALYRERSPVHHIERINAPVLLLQGLQDKVVPPEQARSIVEQLKARNPATRLLCFENEAHGFRNPDNQIQALEAELQFYRAELL